MKTWLWLALLPALAFAIPPSSQAIQPGPIYVDVEPDQLIICPEETHIAKSDVALPGGPFEQFLDQVEAVRDTCHIVLILRPGSAIFTRQLRQMIRDRNIDIHFEPWDADRDVNMAELMADQHPKIPPAALAEKPPLADQAEDSLCIVKISGTAVTIPPDNIVVQRDELQTPENPLERLLDRFEAKGDCTGILLLCEMDNNAMLAQVSNLIRERMVRMGCGPDSNPITVLVADPKSVEEEPKSPVSFECRNQQLFFIDLAVLKKACEEKTTELRSQANNDENEFLKLAGQTTLDVNGQCLDYTYSLMGKYVMMPVPNAKGYSLHDSQSETDDMWFGAKLAALDPKEQFICLFVRPDGDTIFQQARAVALQKDFNVTCERLDEKEPIRLGSAGERIFP